MGRDVILYWVVKAVPSEDETFEQQKTCMEGASLVLHTSLDHIYRSQSHQQYGAARTNKISTLKLKKDKED